MSYIGLLMVSNDTDILEAVLRTHARIVDCFYVLDGTVPNTVSREICESFPECAGYATDADLPRPPYPELTTCGYRQFPLMMAVKDHGWDNWFLELHGDEVWTFDPRDAVAAYPGADGFIFRLPAYIPRAVDGWDDTRPALEQLVWSLNPGWPEFRLFSGAHTQGFDVNQHFDTQPTGIRHVMRMDWVIKHYPYRSPKVQRERMLLHQRTQFDPDNYRHIQEADAVLWTDEMIASWQQRPEFRELRKDEVCLTTSS